MKRVLFLQHYKLEFPFDNWLNMTYEESVSLARGEISPGIHGDIQDYFTQHYSARDFAKYTAIVTSPVRRAQETAELIKAIALPEVPIIVDENLREVTWDLGKFLSKEDYDSSKLQGGYDIGTKRIDAFLEGSGLTSLEEVDARIKSFKTSLLGMPNSNFICVTHSFLMKVLHLYFAQGLDGQSIVASDFDYRFPISYLQGFEVEL